MPTIVGESVACRLATGGECLLAVPRFQDPEKGVGYLTWWGVLDAPNGFTAFVARWRRWLHSTCSGLGSAWTASIERNWQTGSDVCWCAKERITSTKTGTLGFGRYEYEYIFPAGAMPPSSALLEKTLLPSSHTYLRGVLVRDDDLRGR